MNPDVYWRVVAEMTLITVDQHQYVRSMLSNRLPKKAHSRMWHADRALVGLQSTLEAESFRRGGPHDLGVFYPQHRERSREYLRRCRGGRRYPTLTEQEWREIAEELTGCISRIDTLTKLISGSVRAKTLDHAIKYRNDILQVKIALEPFAKKHLGDWAVLYPEVQP